MEQLKMRKPVRRVDISINMEATGANIRRLVKASGYSVRDIMAITGISTEQAVYKWFRGESIPAIETMLILSNALGIEIRELLVIDMLPSRETVKNKTLLIVKGVFLWTGIRFQQM